MFACQNQGGSCFSVKRVLLSIGIFFLCGIGGCKNNEEPQAFMGMKPDEYFICSYEGDEGTDGEHESVTLIDNKGEEVETFLGAYIDKIITPEGFMLEEDNGIIPEGTILLLFYLIDDYTYEIRAYRVGENEWLAESGEIQNYGYSLDDADRVQYIEFKNQIYDRLFEKVSDKEDIITYYGEECLYNKKDENGINTIVNRNGEALLTPEEFYSKNQSLIPAPQNEPGNIELYDMYDSNCWCVGYKVDEDFTNRYCLCRSDGTMIEIEGFDYMESDMDFYRCSSLYGVDNLLFGKYLLMTEQLKGKEYYIKIEGESAKLIDFPEAEDISYEGGDVFLLKNGNIYNIYDAEKEEITCTIDTKGISEQYVTLEVIGRDSYYVHYVKKTEDSEYIQYNFVFGGKEIILNNYKFKWTKNLKNGYVIISFEKDEKETSIIVNEKGEYEEKHKVVEWANRDYYLTREKNGLCIYNMEDKLIKTAGLSD